VQQCQRYWTAGHFFSGYTTRTTPSCLSLYMCAAMPALLDGRRASARGAQGYRREEDQGQE
jgi:hypothetical protein